MPDAQRSRARRSFARSVRLVVVIIAALMAWAAFVALGTYGGWWRTTVAPRADADAFMTAASKLIDEQSKGNVAFALLENGQVFGTHVVSRGRPVGRDTLFQMGSVSKWVTAWGVMKLVEEGKVDLDAPVSRYVRRWQLPKSDFDNNA